MFSQAVAEMAALRHKTPVVALPGPQLNHRVPVPVPVPECQAKNCPTESVLTDTEARSWPSQLTVPSSVLKIASAKPGEDKKLCDGSRVDSCEIHRPTSVQNMNIKLNMIYHIFRYLLL